MFRRCLALGVLILSTTIAAAQDPSLWGTLKAGPYAVGFRTELLYDTTRTYDPAYPVGKDSSRNRSPRPILVALWYPAAKRGTPMRFGDYADFKSVPRSDGFLQRYAAFLHDIIAFDFCGHWPKDLTTQEAAGIKRLFAKPIFSTRNAAPAAGKFPAVIDHPGLGGPYQDNCTLFEFLASHGYVVVSSAYQMAKATQLNIDWDLDRSFRDLAFVARTVAEMPTVDPGRLAVMGHSSGAQAVLAWAETQCSGVGAVVSLDSGLEAVPIDYPGIEKLKAWFDANRNNIRCPVMRLVKQSDEPNFAHLDPYLRYSPSYECSVGSVGHNDFVAEGFIRRRLFPQKYSKKAENEGAFRGYERVCTAVLAFLDSALKADPKAKAWLQSTAKSNGLDGAFTLRYRPGATLPPTARQLLALLKADGIERVIALIRASKDDIDLGGDGVNGACKTLAENGNLTMALKLIHACEGLFPESMPVFSMAGKLNAQSGEKESAIAAYLRCRENIKRRKESDGQKAIWTKEVEDELRKLGWKG